MGDTESMESPTWEEIERIMERHMEAHDEAFRRLTDGDSCKRPASTDHEPTTREGEDG